MLIDKNELATWVRDISETMYSDDSLNEGMMYFNRLSIGITLTLEWKVSEQNRSDYLYQKPNKDGDLCHIEVFIRLTGIINKYAKSPSTWRELGDYIGEKDPAIPRALLKSDLDDGFEKIAGEMTDMICKFIGCRSGKTIIIKFTPKEN